MANLLQVEIARISESFAQNDKGIYLWSKLPQVKCLSFRENIKDTTYRLPKLENFMGKGNIWEPGDSIVAGRPLNSDPKTITCTGISTDPRPVAMSKYNQNAFKDFENGGVVQGLLGELYLLAERQLVAALRNTDIFGAATAFTGTGTYPLSNPAGYSGHTPDLDINNAIATIRAFRGSRFKLVACMSENTKNILARHPSYSGNYSSNASTLDTDEFVTRFKGVHSLDEVFVGNAVMNSAVDGETASYTSAQGQLLWIGLVDTRPADLSFQGSDASPDGGIQIAWGADPYVHDWEAPGSELRQFQGRMALSVFSPRGSAMGVHFDTTDIAG